MSRFLELALLVALVSIASGARASTGYPAEIQNRLSLRYRPDCGICHVGSPGPGNVNTDFGESLIAFGMKGGDTSSLDAALDASQSRHWDSDGDGVSDIDELVRGTDPNGPALARVAGPAYGCSLTHRIAAPIAPSMTAMTILLTLSVLRLRAKAKNAGRR